MPTNTKKKAKVNCKGPNVGACLAADPKDAKILFGVIFDHFAFVDCTDTKLTLDGSNNRRTLEKSTSELLKSLHIE